MFAFVVMRVCVHDHVLAVVFVFMFDVVIVVCVVSWFSSLF